MDRVRRWDIGIRLVAVAITCPAFWFPNFWPAFLLPAIVFLLLQAIAIGHYDKKDTIFKWTDYVYYLLIGGVVALGSRYVLQLEHVRVLDRLLEIQVLQQQLKDVDSELPITRRALAGAKHSLETGESRMVNECAEDLFARRLGGLSNPPSKREVIRIDDPCRGWLALTERVARLPLAIASLEKERAKVASKLQELESLEKTTSEKPIPRLRGDPDRLQLEFVWLPMLLFFGIAIKLGKTTCSLWPSNRPSA